ncbi:MAG: metallophosphoesterase [Bacillota bacterium]
MSFTVLVAITILLAIVSQLYCIKKVIATIRQLFPTLYGRKTKIGITIFLIIFNVYFILFILFWLRVTFSAGNYPMQNSLTFNFLVVYPTFMIFLITLQIGLFLFLFDLIKLILLPLYLSKKEVWKSIEAKAVLVLVVFFIIYVPVRIIYDYNIFPVQKVEYKKQNLPNEMNEFKILFISDIHADVVTNGSRLGRFIEKVNQIHADLVLIGGDMISRGPDYIKFAANELGQIKAKYGVYTCIGDHDFWAYRNDQQKSIREITEALSQNGIPMLDNKNLTINIKSSKILISFITNTYRERIDEHTLENLTSEGGNKNLRILLTHQPGDRLISKAVEKQYDLMLAGHTHGGQITFLFPFKNLTPTLLETKYVKGAFRLKDTLLYVTRGFGMSVIPIRYNSTPEIVVFDLKSS